MILHLKRKIPLEVLRFPHDPESGIPKSAYRSSFNTLIATPQFTNMIRNRFLVTGVRRTWDDGSWDDVPLVQPKQITTHEMALTECEEGETYA